MSDNRIEMGTSFTKMNAAGTRVLSYHTEMRHIGLNEYKVLSAPTPEMLQSKVDVQGKKWYAKWAAREAKRSKTDKQRSKKYRANKKTTEAEQQIDELRNLLKASYKQKHRFDWNSLKDFSDYDVAKPVKPLKPEHKKYPPEPLDSDTRFLPKLSLIDLLFKKRKQARILESQIAFEASHASWEGDCLNIDKGNSLIDKEYERRIRDWDEGCKSWEKDKAAFKLKLDEKNAEVDSFKLDCSQGKSEAITDFVSIVMSSSSYPDFFPNSFELQYNPESGILIVEYQLPCQDSFPTLQSVKYISSRDEYSEKHLSESAVNKLYDDCIYQIALRSVNEILQADEFSRINAVSFNGWVCAINRSTGKEETTCILSLQVTESEFKAIDLGNVDPKLCFRSLKGVASSKLHSITPVKPIIQINKEDSRFVDSYSVTGDLESTNLAAMDWEDFEHLIREIFEKEFVSGGGEVKVTQASRDGGVDAIAFDPDPIRGGKIVIQAKRYTNTVGVAAVRDLYGTVVNEGAIKGILVTTSDYGPDSYNFAKDKPLTLLSGSNLLHLLEKHGHHASIDIREAKRILAEKQDR